MSKSKSSTSMDCILLWMLRHSASKILFSQNARFGARSIKSITTMLRVLKQGPLRSGSGGRTIQHFLNFGAYRLLVFDGVGDRPIMAIEQRDAARSPDLPA